MRRHLIPAGTLLLLLWSSLSFSQNPRQALDDLLTAHKAWKATPVSIEIAGTSTRGSVTQPFKITATREEETLTEYGNQKLISTLKRQFKDDGEKITYSPTLSGFNQLDITGLFLVAQLAHRPVQVEPPQDDPATGLRVIRVSDNRVQKHSSILYVKDKVEVYVSKSGLLAGIARTMYEDSSVFSFPVAYAFSDYREADGVMLPHRIDLHLKGRKVETIQVTSYQINVPAAVSLFTPRRSK